MTLKVAKEAVAEAGRNLQAAAKIPAAQADDDAMIDAVWAFTPTPTGAGAADMERLIASALDFDRDRTSDEFAAISIENLPSVITETIAAGFMRRR